MRARARARVRVRVGVRVRELRVRVRPAWGTSEKPHRCAHYRCAPCATL